ncbi:MAG: hypothetical protein FJW35_01550 [Acidobacteria bacterium]|nr:hypothetical protein [Acidobacteriota bacterium]
MKKTVPYLVLLAAFGAGAISYSSGGQAAAAAAIQFDHNHTFAEVVTYLKAVIETYPDIARLHTIGKSYLGKDLLVLEITNRKNGDASQKPGFWLDGNLHAGEVMGAEVCLKTIDTLVRGYGKDSFVTDLVDTRAIYVMPKLNPDGSDHYLTKPDGMRSSVRPHDSDGDGLLDEDPPEDLNGDRNITQMRVRDKNGNMKTSPDDPRLLVSCKEDEKGEWRTYSEGIDNDNDGRFNEDGVGGLDINRNWPSDWQQEYIQGGAGPYPLSEPETRAVAEFLLAHRSVTGLINHHMAGNFVYRPPTHRKFNPITGVEEAMAPEDEAAYELFGRKYSEILFNQPVRKVYGRGEPPRAGAIWGVMIGWAYDHYGVFSWVPEMGSLAPFCDYDKNGTVTPAEQMKWNDTDMGGRIFVDWKPYDHPQLGQVEIGGFLSKVYHPEFRSYVNVMCTPGPVFEDFLARHAKWNLYLASMSPLVRLTEVSVKPMEGGYCKIEARVQNQGYLPTNVTQRAIQNETAKTVKATIVLSGATLAMGKETVDLGHIRGDRSQPVTAEWMVRPAPGAAGKAVVKITSEKGGTVSREVALR